MADMTWFFAPLIQIHEACSPFKDSLMTAIVLELGVVRVRYSQVAEWHEFQLHPTLNHPPDLQHQQNPNILTAEQIKMNDFKRNETL